MFHYETLTTKTKLSQGCTLKPIENAFIDGQSLFSFSTLYTNKLDESLVKMYLYI